MYKLYTYYRKTVGGICLLKVEIFPSENALLNALPEGRTNVSVLDNYRYSIVL